MALRVLVVGAGIAGAAVSALLDRAGADVTVVERATTARSSGAPVDLRGGALAVASRLGLEETFRSADTGTQRLRFVDRAGRTLARLATRSPSSREIEISRSVLNAGLMAAAGPVEMVMGDGPARITSDSAGVDVAFTSGTSRRFDLVVGADGQHSTVRRLMWGPEQAFRTPIGLAVATLPVPVDVDPAEILLHNEPGVSVGIHPAGGHPVSSFIFRTRARDAPRGRPQQAQLVRDRYSAVGWRTAELLGYLDLGTELYFDLVSRVRVSRWASGRVVLLGDAASSVTILGEGSSMAMIGAERLAEALAAQPDVPGALARYEAAHRPEVERHQRAVGLGAAFLAPRSRLGIAVRDQAVRIRTAFGDRDLRSARRP